MKISKWDISLFILFIIIGISSFVYIYIVNNDKDENLVVIKAGGKVFGEYSLFEDREIEVKENGQVNNIQIKGGKVKMKYATCANQDCIRQGIIHDSSKSIICLPNKVIVEINSKNQEFDSVGR